MGDINSLSPEDVETLMKDDQNYKVWVIQQLVALNKKVDKLEQRYSMLINVQSALLGFVITIITIVVAHFIK